MTCSRCNGNGYTEHWGFVCGPGACGPRAIRMSCALCAGTGNEIPERRDWAERGALLRADRLSRNLSMSEEAKRRGLKVTELSDMETGRREPTVEAERAADAAPPTGER